MDGTTSTWSTPREMVQIILAPRHIKRTVFYCIDGRHRVLRYEPTRNHRGGPRNHGDLDQAALTYVTPLRISNFGLLSATRWPHLSSPGHRRGDEMEIKMTTNPSTS
jgi:hypothetical protein